MDKPTKAGRTVNITLSNYLYNELERLSEEKHLSKSVIVTLALELYMKERGKGRKKSDEEEQST
jgi:metal-responsive CopG/Arc/MetJ family transcriptional regulator